MTGRVPWPAVRMLARHELRSRWRSVIALGIASGIFFGGALATVAVLNRADTAYDRMVAATGLADARVGTYNIFNDLSRARGVLNQLSLDRGSILARTDVVASQQLTAVYARRDTRDVQYMGIWAPRHQWDGLDTPVVVQGRRPAEDRVDEVMVNEDEARAEHIVVGDRIGVGIYRSGQVRDFGNGLGTPRAGNLELLVVGVYRVADAGTGFDGLLAGPAFAARFDASAAIGEILLLRLDRSRESPVFGSVQDQAITLDRQMASEFGVGFYNYIDYVEPRQQPDPAIGPTEGVLRVGLGLLAIVIAIAGLVLTLQLSGRWSVLGRADHGVERALGMRTRDQVISRLLAALPAIAIAVAMSAAGVLLGGYLEPPGALNRFEPHPGWLAQPWTATLGALTVLVLVTTAIVLTRAAVVRRAAITADQSRGRARVPARLALAPVLRLAAALGTARGGRGRTVRSRATVIGLTASLAMLVLVVFVGGQLTRLEHSPAQWGWVADFGVSGDSPQLDERVTADPRVRDADQIVDAPVHVLHRGAILRVTAYGRASLKGALPYRAVAGRSPRHDDEIAIGPRLADELDLHIGDRLVLADPAGKRYEKRIVGVVVTPTLESEPLGRNLLMSRTALRITAISGGYSNLLIRAHDDHTAAGLSTELARDVEIEQRVAPNTVVALGKLTAPARLLVLVLLIGAMLLVAEHVALMLRRRGTQLSIAASIGMTRRQLIVSTATSALLTAAVAVVCGVPLGWALSRVVLVEIGPRLGLGLAGPGIAPTLLVALGGFAVAAVLAFGVAALGLARGSLTDLHSSEGTG